MTRLFPAAYLHFVLLTSTRRPTGRRLSTLLSSEYSEQTQFTLESKQDYPVTLWVKGKELYPSLMFYYLSKSITFNPQVSSKLKLRRSGCRGHSGCLSVTGPMLFRSGETNKQEDKLFKKYAKQIEKFPSRDNWLLGLCRDQHKAWRKCGLVPTAEILWPTWPWHQLTGGQPEESVPPQRCHTCPTSQRGLHLAQWLQSLSHAGWKEHLHVRC